jgi:ankyrin repeat protein
MRLDAIVFEPNRKYVAEAERSTGISVLGCPPGKTTVYNITLTTDSAGRVCGFRDHFSHDLGMADTWDYLKLTDEHSKEVIDLRLHTAAANGDVNMAQEALAEGADVSLRMKQGATPLHWAAASGHATVVDLLLAAGAAIDPVDELGWTPLHLAAQGGHKEIVTILYNKGASLTATINGKTITLPLGESVNAQLLRAAEHGDVTVAKDAIRNGADVNAAMSDGFSALLLAANSSIAIVDLLLAKGADPNKPSNRGYTPLMRAAGLGKRDIVLALLKAGADKSLKDCHGKTAHQLAMEMGERECAALVAW